MTDKHGLDRSYLTKLHQSLAMHFDQEELTTLCFNLGVDYDNLRGDGKESKARELVLYMERRGRISDLKSEMIKQRPNISWSEPLQVAPSERLLYAKEPTQTHPPLLLGVLIDLSILNPRN